MAKKPEPPKLIVWTVYKLAAKQERLGVIEAPDEATAIEKACCGIQGGPANRLMAVRRCPTAKTKSPAAISNADRRITWRSRPKKCGSPSTVR
jgi:hypothetical protein